MNSQRHSPAARSQLNFKRNGLRHTDPPGTHPTGGGGGGRDVGGAGNVRAAIDGSFRRHAQLGADLDLADTAASHDAPAAARARESIDVATAGAGRSPPGDAERLADGLVW
eukprot:COSAG02_NODE_31559_length_531_cov_1.187500_1_plen_111_part_00